MARPSYNHILGFWIFFPFLIVHHNLLLYKFNMKNMDYTVKKAEMVMILQFYKA